MNSSEMNGSSKLARAREDVYVALTNVGLGKSAKLLSEIQAGKPLD